MSYQKEIIERYEAEGYDVVKTIRLNKSGYPDVIAMKNGVAIWIECKEANDTLKPLQRHRIRQLRNNGFQAFATQKGKGIIF